MPKKEIDLSKAPLKSPEFRGRISRGLNGATAAPRPRSCIRGASGSASSRRLRVGRAPATTRRSRIPEHANRRERERLTRGPATRGRRDPRRPAERAIPDGPSARYRPSSATIGAAECAEPSVRQLKRPSQPLPEQRVVMPPGPLPETI